MTIATPSLTNPLNLTAIRSQVETLVVDFLRLKATASTTQGMPAGALAPLADFFAAGGKRLRPTLCVLGWHAAGGQTPAPREVVQVAAALEMFHAFALIHDDVMDDSDTRRGAPTLHRALADQYADHRPRPLTDRLGAGAAILIGDLALCWSDELIHTAGLRHDQLTRILPVLDMMRTEVMYGQYLDVTATGQPTADIGRAQTIIRYKTAKYTIERPLQLGAELAGASTDVIDALSAYAVPLGEAFQLRDDLLGAFGDPVVTGKSSTEDLREGKPTVLVGLALRDAAPDQANVLRRLLGRRDLTEDQATQIRAVLTATGARAQVENMIAQRRERVLALLDTNTVLDATAVFHLRQLADSATRRTS
ncbi:MULTISPECIES: polyprenyl synthetase family protein [Streptomyces]|uniref:polyprenyl synthetase family protein n=1 Tax=Streptomyces TaxID=1883 RepID=UPI001F09151A|nr:MULTISPECIES: polyprenyl synthetase family protein [Streptomyces]MDX3064375.1 polyprenyl synthetase family protein [Streptomyces sp. ND04-05B]MDX3519655.1 polyprenyl synthetase family protein [Streptomyces scabiei]